MQDLHNARAATARLSLGQQLQRDSGGPLAALNLANALWLDDALPEALSWARWATRGGGGETVHPLAWRALGNVLLDLGRYVEADWAYGRADPSFVDAAVATNRAQVALGRGAFAQAWALAEARLRRPDPPGGVLPGPWWQGWPQVTRLTLWGEQGFGDVLQFVRWLPALLASGRQISLLVDAPLQPLLAQGLQWMGPGLQVQARGAEPPRIEGCHGSLLSLPWRLGLAEPPWPGPGGYLRLPSRLALPPAPRPRLGVLWGSGRYLDAAVSARNYHRKSVLGPSLLRLLEALQQRPLELVNLQVGPDRLAVEPGRIRWAEQLDPAADFLALARMLQRLDLVLCVDTAVAHLAGAMDRPAWVLLPWAAECRWQRQRSDTPWYPSLRLWRQPRHGDWDGLWPQLLPALDQWISRWNSAS